VSTRSGIDVHVILLDIEGTTTPLDFVYKTLFPYARKMLKSYLREKVSDGEVQSLVNELQTANEKDSKGGLNPPRWNTTREHLRLDSAAAYCHWLMAMDSKCTPLKSLQGKIWQLGYASGELLGEVYADVPVAFERWRRQERQICIYSSGSILAQQLLFGHTVHGDLAKYISTYFDTRIGAKIEAESFRKIASSFPFALQNCLFISDAETEVVAARLAGMQVMLCARGPASQVQSSVAKIIHSFDEILPD
jgi:enolase-phosphatase E1